MQLTWVLLLMVAVMAAVSWLLHGTRLDALLREHIPDRPQRLNPNAAQAFNNRGIAYSHKQDQDRGDPGV